MAHVVSFLPDEQVMVFSLLNFTDENRYIGEISYNHFFTAT